MLPREREEKREKRKKQAISIFIALIMILSVMGFAISYYVGSPTFEYNGIKFTQISQGYQTKIDGKPITFLVHPDTVTLSVQHSQQAIDVIKNAQALAITYNPTDVYAEMFAQIQFSLEQSFTLTNGPTQTTILRGLLNNTGYTIPLIDCTSATAMQPVIVLTAGNTTGVVVSNNCITASLQNPAQAVDLYEFIRYVRYGVITQVIYT